MATPNPITCSGCLHGIRMCQDRPCWGTPAEIQKIIDAGFGDRLVGDYWAGELLGIDSPRIVAPAIAGKEGGPAPFIPLGRCTFLTEDQKCELHNLGLKPSEGALACCKRDEGGMHQQMAESWANAEGQKIANQWEADRR